MHVNTIRASESKVPKHTLGKASTYWWLVGNEGICYMGLYTDNLLYECQKHPRFAVEISGRSSLIL